MVVILSSEKSHFFLYTSCICRINFTFVVYLKPENLMIYIKQVSDSRDIANAKRKYFCQVKGTKL